MIRVDARVVDLGDDEIADGGDVAAIVMFKPDGRLFVICLERPGGGAEDGRGRDVAEVRTECELALLRLWKGGGGDALSREEDLGRHGCMRWMLKLFEPLSVQSAE